MSTDYKPFNKKVMNKTFPRVFDSIDMYNAIRSHGDRLLFKYFVNGKVEEMTYGQFADMILSLSAAFDSLKLSGEKVVIIGDTSPEWLASYIAVLTSGCIAVPMDKELALTEIEKFMELVDAKAVVYSKSFNEKFLTTMKNHSTIKYFIPINAEYDKTLNRKIVKFKELLDTGREEIKKGYALPEKTDRNKVSEMLFTSGTTGTSKCVMLSQKNIYSVVHCAALQTAFDGNDTILSVLPVHHTYELACLQAGMVLGMKICINDSIRHVTKNMALFKPTGMVLVPMFVTTMYKKIWSEAEKKGKAGALKKAQKLSSALLSVGIDQRNRIFKSVREAFGGNLNKIICGGAKLDPKYIAEFEQFGISIYEGFGITECSPLASVTPYYARKYGSVGPAVDCCSVRIKPNGEKTEQGYDLGEIQVKGDNVMIGYYQNPEATADSFTSDGWFRTGDVGYMDSDGYVFITGRMKFVIVLENGKNVFPEEIEDYLSEIEKISECVVVGRKAENSEEITLTALIYPDLSKFDEGATDEQITEILKGEINAINRNLPAFKQVRAIEIRREEFEKTTTKKIKRHLVK